MKPIDRTDPENPHDFRKTDEWAIYKGQSYWIYRCKNCGMEGLRLHKDEFIYVSDDYWSIEMRVCLNNLLVDKYIGKKILIKKCDLKGIDPEYKDIIPDSVHAIVKPPITRLNNRCGYFVMGKTKPIKILWQECVLLKPRRTK